MSVWWVLLVIASALAIAVPMTWIAARLLGVGRSWVKLGAAGLVGWLGSVLLAWRIGDLDAGGPALVRDLVVFCLVITMATAVLFDLLERPGSLARGEAAGLIEVGNPLARVQQARARAARRREILAIAKANGLNPLERPSRRVHEEPLPIRVRRTLEQCGGVFVKLGQVASTRPDILPEGITVELGHLQADAAPAPIEAVRAQIERELGAPAEEVFAEFSWEPLAAASIAQVHRARLRTGAEVVVKVQRPDVDSVIRRDLDVLEHLARTIERRTTFGHTYQVADTVHEFGESVLAELDFRIEAANTAEIAAHLKGDEGVRVPKLFTELCTPRLLVMEYLPGRPISDRDAVTAAGVDLSKLAPRLLHLALTQMLVDGVFHADLHPGNVLVLDNGDIGLIDFGAVGRLDPITREGLKLMLGGLALQRASLMVQGTRQVATFGGEVDDEELEKAIARFMAVNLPKGLTPSVLQAMLNMYREMHIVLPPDLITMMRALVVVQGTVTEMAPGFSVVAAAKQFAPELAGTDGAVDPDALLRQGLIAVAPVLQQLPSQLGRMLGQLQRGELRTRVSLFGSDVDRDTALGLVNRLGMATFSAVLAIAATLLIVSDGGAATIGDVPFEHVVGYALLTLAVVLGLRFVSIAVREGS